MSLTSDFVGRSLIILKLGDVVSESFGIGGFLLSFCSELLFLSIVDQVECLFEFANLFVFIAFCHGFFELIFDRFADFCNLFQLLVGDFH